VLFSNAGGQPLSFAALVLANGENVAWAISPRAGNLTACEIGNITLAAGVLALQSRAAPYLTRFVVNSNSFAAATRDVEIIVRTFVSASASATKSFVNVTNIARLTAAGTIEYTVTSIDATGVVIRDAATTIYVTTLRADDATVDDGACGAVAYDAAADRHAGSCALPGRAAGRFSLEVAFGSEPVGGGAQHVTVARCPPSFILTADGSECTCGAGRYARSDECVECEPGTAKNTTGVDKSDCAPCVDPATSNAERTGCTVCLAGHYRVSGKNDEGICAPCPDGAKCEQPGSYDQQPVDRARPVAHVARIGRHPSVPDGGVVCWQQC
jgi:hypothetical protein